jgi:hypothetical protein
VFRLFSELHLREMIMLDKKFRDKEAVNVVNLHFSLADIYSVTVFQHFLDQEGFASAVRKCMASKNFEHQISVQGVEFDHIFIRRLHQILNLPEMPTKSQKSTLHYLHAEIQPAVLPQQKD